MPTNDKNFVKDQTDTNVQIAIPLPVLRKIVELVGEAKEDARLERKAIFILLTGTAILLFAVAGYFAAFKIEEIYLRPAVQPISQAARRTIFVDAGDKTSPAGAYAERWVQKVEKNGVDNYPTHLRAKGIHGSVLFIASLRSDGTLERLSILRSSGIAELDNAALTIVKNSTPFEPFSNDLRESMDLIYISRTMAFKNDGDSTTKTR